jgi:hypothetical protein
VQGKEKHKAPAQNLFRNSADRYYIKPDALLYWENPCEIAQVTCPPSWSYYRAREHTERPKCDLH